MSGNARLVFALIALIVAVFALGFSTGVSQSLGAESVEEMIEEMNQRVDDLPETSGQFYLTVVYGVPQTERGKQLEAFLKGSPIMQELIEQVNYNVWTDASKEIRETAWGTFLGEGRPAVILQSPVGEDDRSDIIYFQKGEALPIGLDLIDEMRVALQQYEGIYAHRCPGQRCPVVRPTPKPKTPAPVVVTPVVPSPLVPTVIVNPTPEPEPAEEDSFPLLLLIVPAIAALAGAYLGAKQEESPEEKAAA